MQKAVEPTATVDDVKRRAALQATAETAGLSYAIWRQRYIASLVRLIGDPAKVAVIAADES